jgi:hypothetical protein
MPIPLKDRNRQIGRKVIISLKHKINANPKLKEAILLLFDPFPKLKSRLKGIKSHRHTYMSICQIESPDQLSPTARQFYDNLSEAITSQNPQQPKRGE